MHAAPTRNGIAREFACEYRERSRSRDTSRTRLRKLERPIADLASRREAAIHRERTRTQTRAGLRRVRVLGSGGFERAQLESERLDRVEGAGESLDLNIEGET
jgi:hypothetical protein